MSKLDDTSALNYVENTRESDARIEECEIHDILRNERRKRVIQELQSNSRAMTLNELVERIAEMETGESPPPRNIRKSVYSSLHQSHLPKLDDADVVHYDERGKTVSLGPKAGDLTPYMETTTPYGITWEAYYRRLSLLTLSVVFGAELGAPVFTVVPMLLFLGASLAVVAASATYQLWSDRWRFLRRLD